MFKNYSVWEEKHSEEGSQLYQCSPGTSAATAYDFLTRVRSHVFGIMQEEENKVEKEPVKSEPCEEPCQEQT
ncbi:MAG: hypothetical protein KAS32_30540 [Candidatus Peribacteraceae bacterium]|nr:hypothetical protein [Candidatus Peribacteraceae bacterium]